MIEINAYYNELGTLIEVSDLYGKKYVLLPVGGNPGDALVLENTDPMTVTWKNQTGPQGEPGFSPLVTITPTDHGNTITITDQLGDQTFTVYNGTSPVISLEPLPDGETVTIQDAQGTRSFTIKDGQSPAVYTVPVENGTEITISDREGLHKFTVINGTDGTNGTDGYSPTVETEPTENGTSVTITDESGPHTFTVENGTDGKDGFSPTITTEPVEGGTSVTVTDETGPHEFTVLNGKDGEPGIPGINGNTYSTTEPTMIGSWDGEPLYRISGTSTDSTTVTLSLPSSITQIVNLKCMCYTQNADPAFKVWADCTYSTTVRKSGTVWSLYLPAEWYTGNPSRFVWHIDYTQGAAR